MKRFDTLFLDRDGVLNVKINHGYVLTIGQIQVIPGVKEFLQIAQDYFERIVVVTNQRCVGRGLLTMDELSVINKEVNQLTGSFINKFYVCPHLDEDNCPCRKPKDGMFLQAQNEYSIDFKNSWLVGDSESKKLGITTFFVSKQNNRFADKQINNLLELKIYLEAIEK